MIKVSNRHFYDQYGRQILLHGVNMVCKKPEQNYICHWDDEDFSNLHKWGLNVIRFGIYWDALEPEPGVYNDEYIEKIKEQLLLAKKYDLMIILDMHQDLYSSEFGGGAPAWATLADGEKYESGIVWSDAYLFNKAVQKAFDNFWENRPAEDGIGLQDHYAKAWGYLVKKLGDVDHVIGYDVMNEPFIGSPAKEATGLLFGTFAKLYQKHQKDIALEDLIAAWSDPEQKHELLNFLDNMDVYQAVIEGPAPVLQRFDEEILTDFYEKVAHEIRTVDEDGILFLEANYFSNIGVESMIQPVKTPAGKRDVNQAYAPHTYDFVTDTELAHAPNDERLRFIYEQHEKASKRLEMPMLIGEWGAFYESNEAAHVSVHLQRLIERALCSDTYWDYTPNMDKSASFLGIRRGYPLAVAGEILNYRYEHVTRSFQMKWLENDEVNEPTIVYLPNIDHIKITLSPGTSDYKMKPITGTKAGFIEIPPVGKQNRSLVVVKQYNKK